MAKAASSIPYLLELADDLHREVEHAPPTKYVVTVRRELMSCVEAALRGSQEAAPPMLEGKHSAAAERDGDIVDHHESRAQRRYCFAKTYRRAWTAITSEPTRLAREELADQIARIKDDELRGKLRQRMCVFFLLLEDDLESAAADFGGPF